MRSPTRSLWLVLVLAGTATGCDMFVTCDPETGDGCTTATEKGNCTAHFRQGCSSGNALSWYDSCDNIESLISTCPQGCINNQCLGGCTEAWSCGSWSSCGCDGKQYRTCTDSNSCGTYNSKPAESQTCSVICGNGTCDCNETTASCPMDCSGTSGTCVDDSFELNNDPGSAKPINPGTLTNLKICPSNMDFYRINVPSGYLLTVRIDFDHATGNLDLKLFQDTGMELDSSTSFSNYEYVEGTGTGSNLLIEVFGVGAIANSYTMTVETHSMCTPDISCGSWGTCTCAGGTGIMSRWCTDTLCGNPAYEETQSCSTCGNGTCDTACGENYSNCPVECDDAFEPNNDIPSAYPISTGTISPLFHRDNNDDWFKITVPAGQTLQAQIDFTHALGDLQFRAYDYISNPLGVSLTTNDYEHIDVCGDGSDVYLVTFAGNGIYNSYSLTTSLCSELWNYDDWSACSCSYLRTRLAKDTNSCGSIACRGSVSEGCSPAHGDGACDCGENPTDDPGDCDDGFEPNDVMPDAALFTPGMVTGLQLSLGDYDLYKIYVKKAHWFSARIDFTHANGDLDMQLLKEDGGVLLTSGSSNDFEIVQYSGAAAFLYPKIYGYQNAFSNTYDMTVGVTCPDDNPQEPNNGIVQYTGITTTGVWDNMTICSGDEDWYRVELNDNQTLTVRIDFKNADGDLDLLLRNIPGVLSSSATTNDYEIVTHTNTSGITSDFYIRVYPYATTTNGYKMTVTIN